MPTRKRVGCVYLRGQKSLDHPTKKGRPLNQRPAFFNLMGVNSPQLAAILCEIIKNKDSPRKTQKTRVMKMNKLIFFCVICVFRGLIFCFNIPFACGGVVYVMVQVLFYIAHQTSRMITRVDINNLTGNATRQF